MKLLYATSNDGKVYNMKRRVRGLPIEVITPRDLGIKLEINEDGKTTVENATKKAQAYYDYTKMPTIAGDSAMYIAALPEEKQPGLCIRRVDSKELSDEDMIEHYSKLIEKYGGNSKAWYLTGIALIDEGGLNTIEIEENKFILTSKRDVLHAYRGNPLDVIRIDLTCHKYYSEMTDDEIRDMGYKFDVELVDFLKKYLLI
ncbi:MAG: non-canonical purine NTP pyrophosphatase [Patescibacteria group bacterium]